MADYVLDASVFLAWVLASQATPATDRLLARSGDLSFIAPGYLACEVRSVLLKLEQAGRLRSSETEDALQLLDDLELSTEPVETSAALHGALAVGRAHALGFYDALYVDLAHRTRTVLASRDRKQLRAARNYGVEVYDAMQPQA